MGRLTRWQGIALGAGIVVIAAGVVLHLLPGAPPDPLHYLCRRTVVGPLAAGLTRARLAGQPWPADLAALVAISGSGTTRILRCPADTARAVADPLAEPSVVLIPGLDADMPPATVALHEREPFHVAAGSADVPEGVAYVGGWIATLGGDIASGFTAVTGGESPATARARAAATVADLVARDQRGLAVAGRRHALAAGEAAAALAVTTALTDRDPRIRAFAAWTTGAAGARGLVPALRAALQRPEPSCSAREEQAIALARLGDRAGVPVLLAALETDGRDDPREALGDPAPPFARRARAHAALVALAGTDHGDAVVPGPDARAAACAAWRAWAARP